jgi:hypothetical protein
MEAEFFAAISTKGYERERTFFLEEFIADLTFLNSTSKILVYNLRKITLEDFLDFSLGEQRDQMVPGFFQFLCG